MTHSRLLPCGLLALVLLLGSWVRLGGLGTADLSHDELIHYFAAQSLERGEGPHLPSGERYARGIDLTRLSGLGARIVGDTELGMRLPSALFGILNLVLIAGVAWAIGGPWAAVVATALLAFYPEAVGRSRGVRFYTYQLNFGLIALFALWQVVRRAGDRVPATTAQRRHAWIWGIVAAIAFALAARIHLTTLSVLAGAALAVMMAAAADLWRHGRAAFRTSTPLHLCSAGLVVGAIVLAVDPSIVPTLVAESQYQPLWARSNRGSPLAYYYMLWDAFPLLIALAPPIFIATALRDIRLAVLLALWFGVPLMLHSVAFPWKGERFILVAMPALFIATGIAASMAGSALHAAIRDRVGGRRSRSLATGIVAVVALFTLATTPALRRSLEQPTGRSESMVRRELWQRTALVLHEIPGGDTLPIGSTTPLAALHYLGRADFAVRRDALERPVGKLTVSPLTTAGRPGALFPQGTPDYYAGVPVLTTPDAIRERFRGRGEVLIVIDSTRWVFGDIEAALKRTLLTEAPEICRGRCGALMAFRWSLGRSSPGAIQ